jgi:hypothetical protein
VKLSLAILKQDQYIYLARKKKDSLILILPLRRQFCNQLIQANTHTPKENEMVRSSAGAFREQSISSPSNRLQKIHFIKLAVSQEV